MKEYFSFKRVPRNEAGFTLIEILVVILVIGILAAIAVPVFLNQRQKSAEASLVSDLKSLGLAMETDLVNNKGKYSLPGLPADFKPSRGNAFQVTPESGSTNVAAGSSDGGETSVYPGRIGYYSNGAYPNLTYPSGSTFASYASVTADTWGGPYWDYIQTGGGEIPAGQAFSGSLMVKNSHDICFNLRFEQHKSTPGWANIDGPNTCLVAGQWKEMTISGVTEYPVTQLTLIAYGGHAPGSTIEYKAPTIVIGSEINKNNLAIATNQRYCVQGYNDNDKTNIWKYSTLNGGVSKGRC